MMQCFRHILGRTFSFLVALVSLATSILASPPATSPTGLMPSPPTSLGTAILACLLFVVSEFSMALEPSVQYVVSEIQGNFFVAKHKTFSPRDAIHIFNHPKSCVCWSMCLSFGKRCQAWSVTQLATEGESAFECRITDKGPIEAPVINHTDATYYFRETSIKGKYSFGSDNILYVELRKKLSFDDALVACSKIPGHRLIMPKTQASFDYFMALRPDVDLLVLNLVKNTTEVVQWGDGTHPDVIPRVSFSISADMEEPIFIRKMGMFVDRARDSSQYVIYCQANPLGIEW